MSLHRAKLLVSSGVFSKSNHTPTLLYFLCRPSSISYHPHQYYTTHNKPPPPHFSFGLLSTPEMLKLKYGYITIVVTKVYYRDSLELRLGFASLQDRAKLGCKHHVSFCL